MKPCLKCGKETNRKKYCSVECRKMGQYRHCENCGAEFYAKAKEIKRGWGRFCSHKCFYTTPRSLEYRENLAKWQRGEKSQFWQGGISSEMQIKYSSSEWQKIRQAVYQRDGYACKQCGRTDKLDCHHIIPYRIGKMFKHVFWNVGVDDAPNLVTLCKSCHKKLDNKLQKGETSGFTPILHKITTI